MSSINTIIPAGELPKTYLTELTNGLTAGMSVYEIITENIYVNCFYCDGTGRTPQGTECMCCHGFKKIAFGKRSYVAERKITEIDVYIELTEQGVDAEVEGVYLDDNCTTIYDEDIYYISRAQAEKVCAEKNKKFGYVEE